MIPNPKVCKFYMSVDPSINTCGLALWRGRKLFHYELLKPKTKSKDPREKAKDMFNQIKKIYEELGDCQIVVEGQQQFGIGGYMSRESGSIQKLIFLTGMIASIENTVVLDPRDWKGQMSKEVTANRLDRIYPDLKVKEMDDNIADAIGIGQKFLYGRL